MITANEHTEHYCRHRRHSDSRKFTFFHNKTQRQWTQGQPCALSDSRDSDNDASFDGQTPCQSPKNHASPSRFGHIVSWSPNFRISHVNTARLT